MIIYQSIYIFPTSFTEYAPVEVTSRVTPSGLKLKTSGSNTQVITPMKLGETGEFKNVIFFLAKQGEAKLIWNF